MLLTTGRIGVVVHEREAVICVGVEMGFIGVIGAVIGFDGLIPVDKVGLSFRERKGSSLITGWGLCLSEE